MQLCVGLASSFYSTQLVLLAFAMTASVSTGLFIYAMRTKTDFTPLAGVLYACLTSLLLAMTLGLTLHTSIFE
jgi:FtsH-binding integral membrane protein